MQFLRLFLAAICFVGIIGILLNFLYEEGGVPGLVVGLLVVLGSPSLIGVGLLKVKRENDFCRTYGVGPWESPVVVMKAMNLAFRDQWQEERNLSVRLDQIEWTKTVDIGALKEAADATRKVKNALAAIKDLYQGKVFVARRCGWRREAMWAFNPWEEEC